MSRQFDFGELNPEFANDMANIDGSRQRSNYAGLERRQCHRRKAEDRRIQLRFEPGKCLDRRELCDRRIVAHNYQSSIN